MCERGRLKAHRGSPGRSIDYFVLFTLLLHGALMKEMFTHDSSYTHVRVKKEIRKEKRKKEADALLDYCCFE